MLKNTAPILSRATGLVFSKRWYQVLGLGLGVPLTFIYLILLPSLPLGRVTLEALSYITPIEFVFSVLMGSTLSLVVVMNVYALRTSRKACSRKAVALSIFAGIVPNSLCCTTVVPTLIGFLALSTNVLFTVSPAIQSFLVRYAILFYATSFLSLLYSLQMIARDLAGPKLAESSVTNHASNSVS